MKFAFKSIVAATAFVAAGTAFAAAQTVNVGGTISGLKLDSGSGTLALSSTLLAAADSAKLQFAGVNPVTPTIVSDSFGYLQADFAAPIASVVVDGGKVVAAQTTGGAKQTITAGLTRLSTGGEISITNIYADLVTKAVFADVSGANGLASGRIHMWDFTSLVGSTDLVAGSTTVSLQSLKATTTGFNAFVLGLGLTDQGATLLKGVDFGNINSTVVASKVSTIPEPSTYALMAVGLLGLGMVARRRAK